MSHVVRVRVTHGPDDTRTLQTIGEDGTPTGEWDVTTFSPVALETLMISLQPDFRETAKERAHEHV